MAQPEGGNNLSQLRNLVRQYIDNHLYESALFWADKACSLSKNSPQDVLWLSHSLFLTKQPLRAAQLLKASKLLTTSSAARYLAAKCYVECKEWRSALEVLEGEDKELKSLKAETTISYHQTSFSSTTSTKQQHSQQRQQINLSALGFSGVSNRKLEAAISLIKGIIYDNLDNRDIATQCYKDALQHDVYCYEAFNLLISHHGLTATEENELIENLPYGSQCNDEEMKIIKFAYKCKISKYAKPIEEQLPPNLEHLSNNLDYIVSLAERHFNNSNYREAYDYAKYVLNIDRLHEGCLPLYISCLSVLKKKNDLYNLAHDLVNTYPTKSISWYAIGTYYLIINKNEAARKYFSKATTIDPAFGPSWLGFAHSFSSEGERDQAISAYFSASKYMPGSHLPYLYLGLEYSRSHDMKLATKFYKEALLIAPNDPHIKLELGAMTYENGEYEKSETYLLDCLNQIENMEDNVLLDIWEPLYNNLGHVSRKLKNYSQAITYHEHALRLNPKNSSTCSSIGLCYMLTSEYEKAVPLLHKALSLKRNDTISIQMLNEALKILSSSNGIVEKDEELLTERDYEGSTGKESSLEQMQDTTNADSMSIEMSVEMSGANTPV